MPTFIVTLTVRSAKGCRRHWALKATRTGLHLFYFCFMQVSAFSVWWFVHAVSEGVRKGCQIPQNWSQRWLWLLGNNPGSSASAASHHNLSQVSIPMHSWKIFFFWQKTRNLEGTTWEGQNQTKACSSSLSECDGVQHRVTRLGMHTQAGRRRVKIVIKTGPNEVREALNHQCVCVRSSVILLNRRYQNSLHIETSVWSLEGLQALGKMSQAGRPGSEMCVQEVADLLQ